jgi:hypothetical protein
MTIETDTTKAPVTHSSGWHTYDATFKVQGTRGLHRIMFFSENDDDAIDYAMCEIEQAACFIGNNLHGTPKASDIKLTRRA